LCVPELVVQYLNARISSHLYHVFITDNPKPYITYPTFIINTNKTQIPAARWTHLTHRRLQAIPSTLTKNNTLLAAPLPAYLITPILPRFEALAIFKETPHGQPNHVLVNEYRKGEGIMPHEDGDAYAGVVATVSLGGGLCLDVLPKPVSRGEETARDEEDELKIQLEEEKGREYNLPTRIFQEPRSLLITTGTAYRELMHGIRGIEVDEDLREGTVANWALLGDKARIEEDVGRNVRGTRVSLTYRDVLKVSKAAGKVFGGLVRR
jgi:alkylated DNA repair protein alkB family protein 6